MRFSSLFAAWIILMSCHAVEDDAQQKIPKSTEVRFGNCTYKYEYSRIDIPRHNVPGELMKVWEIHIYDLSSDRKQLVGQINCLHEDIIPTIHNIARDGDYSYVVWTELNDTWISVDQFSEYSLTYRFSSILNYSDVNHKTCTGAAGLAVNKFYYTWIQYSDKTVEGYVYNSFDLEKIEVKSKHLNPFVVPAANPLKATLTPDAQIPRLPVIPVPGAK